MQILLSSFLLINVTINYLIYLFTYFNLYFFFNLYCKKKFILLTKSAIRCLK